MARRKAVYPLEQWTGEVGERLPHLSRPQAAVLAAWSFGMVLAHSCALTAVAGAPAALWGGKANTERQRLREFCYPKERKRGAHRQATAVEPCFAPLLGWVLARWPSDHVLLGLDATTLGERFVVLAISVLYRGCAIPVAWAIVPAGKKGAWRPVWERLLAPAAARQQWRHLPARLLASLPRPAPVRAHPRAAVAGHRLRLQEQRRPPALHAPGPLGARPSRPLAAADRPGARGRRGRLVRAAPVDRARVQKHEAGGWQWQQTKMTDPERAERLWLAIAVATLWLLAVGGEAEAAEVFTAGDAAVVAMATGARRSHRRQQPRLVGVFRRGWCRLLAAVLTAAPLPLGAFLPEPLPQRAPLPTTDLHDDPTAEAA